MTRATFFKHFELLADQPDAVAKMRGLVMQLAIRGELIRQNPTDKHAQTIFATQPKPIAESDAPYTLPDGWIWVQLSQLANVIRGVSYQKHDSSVTPKSGCVPVLRANNIGDGLNFDVLVYVPRSNVSPEQFIQKHDVIVAMSSGSKNLVGKAAQAKEDYEGGFGAFCGLLRLKESIHPQYFGLFLQTPFYRERIAALGQGIGINNLQKGSLENLPIPLPPLAEQRRIVAKVDELMALCGELERRQQARQHARQRLNQSAYHHLTSSSRSSRRESALTEMKTGKSLSGLTSAATRIEENDFRHPAKFVLREFAELTAEPDDVPQLRQAILQLAVQGRLVPQNLKDEPASVIMGRCQREAKKLRIETAEQQPIGSNEAPFELPTGWSWARLRHVGYLMGGGTPSKSKSELWEGNLPWVSPKDMKVTHLADSEDHISRIALGESAVKLIPQQSLLFVVRGMILIHSFPSAINTVEVTINQDMKALRPFVPETVEFLLLACRGFKHQMVERVDRSTHGTCKLITEKVTEFIIGLPPLAEQKRIVARVEELMRWCDALEAQLSRSRTLGAHLLDSTLHHLLAA